MTLTRHDYELGARARKMFVDVPQKTYQNGVLIYKRAQIRAPRGEMKGLIPMTIEFLNRALRPALALGCAALLALTGCKPQNAETPAGGGQTAKPETKSAATTEAAGGEIKAGKWTIIDTRTDQTDQVRAKQNVEEALIKYPKIGCLVGLWSYNGPAIFTAVTDSGMAGKVKIVCFDEDELTLTGVEAGTIFATVVQQPFEFGYQSVKLLDQLAKGDKSGVPANKTIEIPVKVIRKDNVAAFQSNMKAMLAAKPSGAAKPGANTYAFVTNNTAAFWQIARAGITKAEQELGVACEFQMPSDGTPAEQTRLVEAMLAKQVKGMAISPCDPENQTELINRACDTIKNVITQDSDAPKSKRVSYLGTNNYKAGREAGKLIKEALPDGGTMMIFVGRLDAQNAKDRRQGIIDELQGSPIPQ